MVLEYVIVLLKRASLYKILVLLLPPRLPVMCVLNTVIDIVIIRHLYQIEVQEVVGMTKI